MSKMVTSYSRIMCMQMCGESARRRYVEKERNYSNFLALRGQVVHKTRKHNLSQKIDSHEDEPVSVLTDYVRDAVVQGFSENEVSPDVEHEGLGPAALCSEAIDTATKLVEADYKSFQIKTNPLAVELDITVELERFPFDLRSILDLVEVGGALRDLKTMKRTPSEGDIGKSEQLTIYDLTYRAKYQKPPTEISWDCLITLKGGIKDVRMITERTPDDHRAVLARIAMAQKAFDMGVFVPCDSSHWKCSANYCEYYPTCPYVIKGKRK